MFQGPLSVAHSFGVWLNVVCTPCVCGEKDFLGSTLAVRKGDFEGIWNDVSCICDYILAYIGFHLDIRKLYFDCGAW